MHKVKILMTDLAGVGLIILAVLTGWIPGPGGIPLFLAGLGLLAINHEWARRWLRQFKTHGLKLAELFFREHPVLKIIYDALALALVAGGIILLVQLQGLSRTFATVLLFLGLGLFFGNRKRLQKITAFFKRQP